MNIRDFNRITNQYYSNIEDWYVEIDGQLKPLFFKEKMAHEKVFFIGE